MPAFQNQVFLENQKGTREMLKNQAFARAVPGGVLEGCGFDAWSLPWAVGWPQFSMRVIAVAVEKLLPAKLAKTKLR